jgi:hypothetical protein
MTSHQETPEPPRISYRRIHEEGSQGDEGVPVSEKMRPYADAIQWTFTALTWFVLFFVLLVWAVVGAVFWIPLMLRATLRFSLRLLETMFEGRKPAKAALALRDAVSFYRRGFVVAVEVITGEKIDERDDGPVTENRLVKEFFWALLVWYFIALLFGWIQASPLDLVDWFRSIPWGEYFGDLVDRFRGMNI